MADSPTSAFDPYHKWLGIPPSEQPPDYYRLLGVPQFETDADVIAISADRQMAHVKSFATGRYSTSSQKLLSELSRARVCLLKPTSKQAYDDRIRVLKAEADGSRHVGRTARSTRDVQHAADSGTTERPERTAANSDGDLASAAHLNREPIQATPCSPPAGPVISVAADWAAERLASRKQTGHPSRWALGVLVAVFAILGPIGAYLLLKNAGPARDAGEPQGQQQRGGPNATPRPPPTPELLSPRESIPKVDSSTVAISGAGADAGRQSASGVVVGRKADESLADPDPGAALPKNGEGQQRGTTRASGSFTLDLSRPVIVIEIGANVPRDAVVAVEEIKALDTPYVMSPADGIIRENQPVDVELTEFRAAFKQVSVRLSLKWRAGVLQLRAAGKIDAGLKTPFNLTREGLQRLRRLSTTQLKRLGQQLTGAKARRAQIEAAFVSRRMVPVATRQAMIAELNLLIQRIPTLENSWTAARRDAAAIQELSGVAEQINGKTEIVYRVRAVEKLPPRHEASNGAKKLF
jgi:hypothetical protein